MHFVEKKPEQKREILNEKLKSGKKKLQTTKKSEKDW